MSKKFRLVCSYTKREWILIDNGTKSLGKKSTLNYLISEIKNLEKLCDSIAYKDEDEKYLEIQKRQFYPPEESIEILKKLSERLNLPPSTIVSRLLLNPLLKND